MTKIRIASDLHLEFYKYDSVAVNGKVYFTNQVIPLEDDEKNTILVLAGDIMMVNGRGNHYEFFKDLSERFKYVVYVFGNHENYKTNIRTAHSDMRRFLKDFPNIHVLENEHVVLDDITFWGATMWTDFDRGNPIAMFYAGENMSDFHVIGHGPEDNSAPLQKFTPSMALALHEYSLYMLREFVKNFTGEKLVVVTHHAPSRMSSHKKYEGSMLNPAFYSDLDHIMVDSPINLWIHGHTHDAFDYVIDKTRVVCNPQGYGLGYEQLSHNAENKYNPKLTIDI